MNQKLKKFVIDKNKSIKDAIKKINTNGQKTCFVLDENKRLYGSITDGDIRRRILKNEKSINDKIQKYCNKKTKYIFANSYSLKKIKKIFLAKKIEILPILNNNKKIVDVTLKSEVFNLKKKKKTKQRNFKSNLSVVIMAGGKGQRLDPITRIFPKPLVPIKDKTAIENIIDNFSQFGINKFHLILNYKSEIIKAFFKSKQNLIHKILYHEEKKPLGTAGGLEKLKNKIKGNFIVTNCDVFFNFDLNLLVQKHFKNKYDLTLVVSNQNSILPYGVCKLDNENNFLEITEKPKFKHLITTGLYIINSSILDIIPKNKYLDMNSLIETCKKKNMKIGIFKISKNNWQDIGQLTEYKKNLSLLSVKR